MVIVLYHHCFITQLSIKRRIPSHRNRRQGSSAETKRFALNTTHTHIFTLPILGQTLFHSYFKESLQLLSCQVVMTFLHRIWRWYKATILTAWRSQCWYFTVLILMLCFSWYPAEGQGGVRAASGAGHPVLWLGGGHGRLRGHAAVLFQKPVQSRVFSGTAWRTAAHTGHNWG